MMGRETGNGCVQSPHMFSPYLVRPSLPVPQLQDQHRTQACPAALVSAGLLQGLARAGQASEVQAQALDGGPFGEDTARHDQLLCRCCVICTAQLQPQRVQLPVDGRGGEGDVAHVAQAVLGLAVPTVPVDLPQAVIHHVMQRQGVLVLVMATSSTSLTMRGTIIWGLAAGWRGASQGLLGGGGLHGSSRRQKTNIT
jgi:hypothetical protein